MEINFYNNWGFYSFAIYWREFFNHYTYHFPTQNLLSDAESNICKYNAVIINDITLF